MILVLNRRLQLSGNNFLILILISFLFACSKKTAPVLNLPPKPVEKETTAIPGPVKKIEKVPHAIALLLPFYLNEINIQSAVRNDINKAILAIDYYQGFKLALDSLSGKGNSFKLNVWDTREQEVQIINLARSKSVQTADLIVGPVFPESIKAFNEFYNPVNKLQISPLAASIPFGNINTKLVTVNNTIDQHGWKIADYINRNYKPSSVNLVLINTRKNDDEKFAAPIRSFLKSLSNNGFLINERTNSIGLETALISSKINLIILTSDDKTFILPTVDRLYKLSMAGIKIELFGHPNWIKSQFLAIEKMQGLNTKITSSYFIDYKSGRVRDFTSRYRQQYGLEPTEFAFKGFDTGYYFGKLLCDYGGDYESRLSTEKYDGLHTKFHFKKDEKSGFTNSEILILKYSGFELEVIK